MSDKLETPEDYVEYLITCCKAEFSHGHLMLYLVQLLNLLQKTEVEQVCTICGQPRSKCTEGLENLYE